MEKAQIKVTMPSEILLDFGFSEENADMGMLELFVTDLYKQNHISCDKRSEIL